TAASGAIRHTWTATTEMKARLGRPSQYMFWSMRPTWRSSQSIGEKTESSVHNQVRVASETGATQGRSTRNLTNHFPLKSRVSNSASPVARITTNRLEITANQNVLPSARRNTVSFHTALIVSSPTNSSEGSPVVMSVKA